MSDKAEMAQTGLGVASTAASLIEGVPGVATYIPGVRQAAYVASAGQYALDPMVKANRAEKGLGRNLGDVNTGYADDSDFDPVAESKGLWAKKAARGFGKTAMSIAVATGMMAAGAAVGAVVGSFALPIPFVGTAVGFVVGIAGGYVANKAAGWAFDKIIPDSKAQDAVSLVSSMKEGRSKGRAVTEAEMGAAMIGSIAPDSEFRKDVEKRLKKMTGERDLTKILERNPQAITLVLQDPLVLEDLSDQYGALADPQFLTTATRLFNENRIGARDVLHPNACSVSNACMQEMAKTMNIASQNLPNLNSAQVSRTS